MLKEKNFQQAREVFEQAYELDQANPYILSGLGECLKNLGHLPEAVTSYEKLLELESGNLFALRGLGDICKIRREYDRAISLWLEYLKYRPKDVYVLSRIADGYKMIGRYRESEEYYLKILGFNPSDTFSFMGLADLYHKTGQQKPAIAHYEKVLEKSPNLINILTIVGNLYWQCGEVDKAMHHFTRALEVDPKNTYAWYGMGNCHRLNRDYHRVIQCWEPLLETEDITIALLSRLGDVYRNVGRFDDAETVYLRCLSRGYNRFAQLGLLKLYCLQGRDQEVCRDIEVLFGHEGADLRILDDLCGFFLQSGRKEAAIRLIRCIMERPDLGPGELQVLAARTAELEGTG